MRVGEALNECRSPWVSILIRRCFGMAGALHAPKYGEALNLRYAWPSARWGSIPIEGGVMAAHKAEIETAPDPAAKRAELEAFYLNMTSPFRTAEKFGILDISPPMMAISPPSPIMPMPIFCGSVVSACSAPATLRCTP